MAELGIKLIGPIYDFSGISQCVREMALALDATGIKVNLIDMKNFCTTKDIMKEEKFNKLKTMENTPLTIPYVAIHFYPPHLIRQIDQAAKANISWSLYETDRIPYVWSLILNNPFINEAWVPTQFNFDTYKKQGVDEKKLSIVNLGVDTEAYNPNNEILKEIKKDNNFYFSFISAWKICKGYDSLFRVFFDEFKNNKDVKLIFKTHLGDNLAQANDMMRNSIKQIKGDSKAELIFIGNNLPEEQVKRLYRTGDCFVLPNRGEGWGFGLIQSMASGVPVITTRCSAQMTYCNDENSLLIDAEYKKIDNVEWLLDAVWQQEHWWWNPDEKQLREKMRFAYENRDKIKEIGMKGHEDVQKYSWSNVAMQVINQISKYA